MTKKLFQDYHLQSEMSWLLDIKFFIKYTIMRSLKKYGVNFVQYKISVHEIERKQKPDGQSYKQNDTTGMFKKKSF